MNTMFIDEKMFVKVDKPIGFLKHEPTNTAISVYKKINIFQRWMLNLCFGLRYEGNKKPPLTQAEETEIR